MEARTALCGEGAWCLRRNVVGLGQAHTTPHEPELSGRLALVWRSARERVNRSNANLPLDHFGAYIFPFEKVKQKISIFGVESLNLRETKRKGKIQNLSGFFTGHVGALEVKCFKDWVFCFQKGKYLEITAAMIFGDSLPHYSRNQITDMGCRLGSRYKNRQQGPCTTTAKREKRAATTKGQGDYNHRSHDYTHYGLSSCVCDSDHHCMKEERGLLRKETRLVKEKGPLRLQRRG